MNYATLQHYLRVADELAVTDSVKAAMMRALVADLRAAQSALLTQERADAEKRQRRIDETARALFARHLLVGSGTPSEIAAGSYNMAAVLEEAREAFIAEAKETP